MVCSNLQLLEKDWFSLVYRVNNVKYWLNHERKISKQLKNAAWDFSFQVKFYPSEPTIMHEDLTRYQLFLQVRTDIYTGKLPCSFVTYSLLGSYAAQSEFGDYDPQELGHGIQYLKDAAPYAPNQSDDLLERICELHTSHARMNPADAEMAYLENAKVLALYGVDLHFAKDEDFSDVMVGVCSYGLNVYREKLRMHRFPWAKIIKFGYKRSMFYIKIRSSGSKKDPANLTYKLANHSMAKRLWKSAVEHHAFFRLKVAEPPVKGMFPLFTSRFRYSGRTQHETCNEYHDIDRKTPTIDRAASRRYAGGLNKPYDNPTGTGLMGVASYDGVYAGSIRAFWRVFNEGEYVLGKSFEFGDAWVEVSSGEGEMNGMSIKPMGGEPKSGVVAMVEDNIQWIEEKYEMQLRSANMARSNVDDVVVRREEQAPNNSKCCDDTCECLLCCTSFCDCFIAIVGCFSLCNQ